MSSELKVVVWDVQHGNAAYINTPGNQHIVIDLGIGAYKGSDASFSPLLHLQKQGSVKHLDGVIITHPHRDHIDDIFNFDKLSPRVLFRPKHLSEDDIRTGNQKDDKDIIDKYLEIHHRYSNPVATGEDPCQEENNGGVLFQLFTPSSCARSNLNNHSMVTVITYAGSKIIIPGDNEPCSWNELLGRNDFLAAIKGTDVFIAPHHGRESGFSSALFERMKPWLIVISDGPFSDTSCTDRYGQNAKGWTVHKRSGGKEERKCVTTRNDGVIDVRFGRNDDGGRYIKVIID